MLYIRHYPSGRHSLGPHLGRRVAHELAMMYDGDNVAMRRPQSSFDVPYSKYLFLSFIIEFFILKVEHKLYQQLNEFAQDSRQNHEGEHSFENRDGSSGSDSEMERIHNKQEMARQAAAIRYDSLPLTAPNEFYYFGVIQLPQDSRQNHEGEHSFENRDGSSGSDSEMERIHNKQEMARQAAAIRYDSLPLTAPNEFYYFGVIQLPQVSDF
ncbi:unnamed protein product [Brugia pahangi]|uniref:Uncharacterized protein n=1 Tax=Brugia pahangi TaxID=6280 RepID=A0A0N4T6U2_BRUPA|nr:unnamed protein product [Brugia pahangi]